MDQRNAERRALRWLVAMAGLFVVTIPLAVLTEPPVGWLVALGAFLNAYVRFDRWRSVRKEHAERTVPT